MTRKYALYALAIIFFGNFLNYLDRMLVSALEKPVSQALQLTGGEEWTSNEKEEEHSAQIVFGSPGNGRRLTFIFFSIFMLISSVVCFLAKKHAKKDTERVMKSLTQNKKKAE